eukprot:TRINITY_DN1144_c0_g1_i7.p1 TRINITY_DN1144_c0_g1~~TRINITY_DN1144_c0_g1_i7.p1  ORF type:complete len:121 (+),score=18.20 TRINITY_DN1144_c0_g1_i7:99-461(+)
MSGHTLLVKFTTYVDFFIGEIRKRPALNFIAEQCIENWKIVLLLLVFAPLISAIVLGITSVLLPIVLLVVISVAIFKCIFGGVWKNIVGRNDVQQFMTSNQEDHTEGSTTATGFATTKRR